jgi:hypothetical protein
MDASRMSFGTFPRDSNGNLIEAVCHTSV